MTYLEVYILVQSDLLFNVEFSILMKEEVYKSFTLLGLH